MGYEIDFLPVGQSGPGGDAISLRIGDLKSGRREDQFVAIVDGGYTGNGHKLVEHVQKHYGTEAIDLVISTHLDRDHIQGLSVVVQELAVGELWMLEPSEADAQEIEAAMATATGERQARLQAITASISDSQDLASFARTRGVEIVAPYTGCSAAAGALRVLGPTQEYYASLVPQFRNYTQVESLKSMVASGLEKRTGKAPGETLYRETLEEGSRTEAENSSSVITLIEVGNRSVILTGDAGADALNFAADHLDQTGFDWDTLRAIQIPHHGSRNNVTPSVLNRYLGEPVQADRTKKQAYVSCSPNGAPLFPSKRVTNACFRRGCCVYKTAGSTKRLHHDAPPRDGYTKAEEIPFFSDVD